MLSIDVDWLALLIVTIVTVAATALIAGLMSLTNWFFTVREGEERVSTARAVAGYALLVVMGLIVLYGLYLIIPYFHSS